MPIFLYSTDSYLARWTANVRHRDG